MRDIIYSEEELNKKLEIVKKDKVINLEIANYRCPVCGGELEYVLHPGGGDSIVIPFVGELKCSVCNMFSKKVSRDSYQSYHWKYDGSSEISLKEDVWNSVKSFVKKK